MRWLVRKASDSSPSPSPSSSSSTLVLIIECCKSIFLIITIIIIIITILQQSSGKMIIMDNLHAMVNHTVHHHHHQHHHVSDPSYITRPLQMKDHYVANLDSVRYKSSANRFLQFLQLHANLTKLPTNLHTRKLLGIPKQGNFTPLSPSTQLVADSSLGPGPGPASQPISSSTRSTVFHTNTKNGKHHKPYNHGNMQHNSSSSLDNNNNIDPRYGVEKRLVPTGPNPLHN